MDAVLRQELLEVCHLAAEIRVIQAAQVIMIHDLALLGHHTLIGDLRGVVAVLDKGSLADFERTAALTGLLQSGCVGFPQDAELGLQLQLRS